MSELGYISDQPWMHTYQPDISPRSICFTMGLAGLPAPEIRAYCELAYGQGLTLAIHAACNQDVEWIGTDFNPIHARFIGELSRNLKLQNIKFYNQEFKQFCTRTDIGALDVVALMGTWSWLPEIDQAVVAGFLSPHLRPGGVFCLNYSTLPGQTGTAGLRCILQTFAGRPDDAGGPLSARIPDAVQRTMAFLDINPAFSNHHWNIRAITEELMSKDPGHLAHEYFNYNWRPQYFSDLAALMARARLHWACPLSPSQGLDVLRLTPRQSEFLREVEDPVKREQLRDLVCDTSQRGDVWVKASPPKRKTPGELLGDLAVVLVRPADSFDFEVHGSGGVITLSRTTYGGVIEELAPLRPLTLRELARRLDSYLSLEEMCPLIAILIHKRMIQIVNPSQGEIDRSIPTARSLNRAILEMARSNGTVLHLGSPLTGTGIEVSRMHQLFLLSREDGARDVDSWSRFAMTASNLQGADHDHGALIRREAEMFERTYLPIYQSLLIAA